MDSDQDGTGRPRFVTNRRGVTEDRAPDGGERSVDAGRSGSSPASTWGFLWWIPTVLSLAMFGLIVVGIVSQIVADNESPRATSPAASARRSVTYSLPTLPPLTPYVAATTAAPRPRGLLKGDCLDGSLDPEIVPCDSGSATYVVTGPTRDGLICPADTDASFISLGSGTVCARKTHGR